MRQLCLLCLLIAGVLSLPATAQNFLSTAPDPILGHWRWYWSRGGPALVDFNPDGSVDFNREKRGVWKSIPVEAQERKYQITWDGGKNIDDITLDIDGTKFSGKTETVKQKVWAVRMP